MKAMSIFILLFSSICFAGMHEIYSEQEKKESEPMTALTKDLKLEKPVACAAIAEKTLVSCFKIEIEKLVITSSAQVYPLIRLGTELAERDANNRKYDEATKNLVTSEVILSVMEQIKPTKFHVNTMRPLGTLAEMELKQIKKDEEKTLQLLINQQVIDIVKKKLKAVEKLHADPKVIIPDAMKTWQEGVLKDLKLRMEKMRVMKFLLP